MDKPRKRKGPASRDRRRIKVDWSDPGPLPSPGGKPYKRFFKAETLAAAVEAEATAKEAFFLRAVQEELGPGEVSTLAFTLARERRCQLEYRMEAANVRRKRGRYTFVAAKNAQECNTATRQLEGNLQQLHHRAPEWVLQPLRYGFVPLVARRREKAKERNVFAYVAEWPQGFEALGFHKNLQIALGGDPRRTVSKAETEQFREAFVELVFRTYNPGKRTGLNVGEVSTDDLLVKRTRGPLLLKLIACRDLAMALSPNKLIHQVLRAKWNVGGGAFMLCPADPEAFVEAVLRAAGPQQGRGWLQKYVADARKSKAAPSNPEFLEALAGLVLQ